MDFDVSPADDEQLQEARNLELWQRVFTRRGMKNPASVLNEEALVKYQKDPEAAVVLLSIYAEKMRQQKVKALTRSAEMMLLVGKLGLAKSLEEAAEIIGAILSVKSETILGQYSSVATPEDRAALEQLYSQNPYTKMAPKIRNFIQIQLNKLIRNQQPIIPREVWVNCAAEFGYKVTDTGQSGVWYVLNKYLPKDTTPTQWLKAEAERIAEEITIETGNLVDLDILYQPHGSSKATGLEVKHFVQKHLHNLIGNQQLIMPQEIWITCATEFGYALSTNNGYSSVAAALSKVLPEDITPTQWLRVEAERIAKERGSLIDINTLYQGNNIGEAELD